MSEGIQFPYDEETGRRTSTGPAKSIWSKAFGCVDKELTAKVISEKNWRKNYGKHIKELTRLSVKTPEMTIQVAEDGLNEVYNQFEFVRDGETCLLKDAMEKYQDLPSGGMIKSDGKSKVDFVQGLGVEFDGKKLCGDDLIAEIEKRAHIGELENDVVEAIRQVIKNGQEWQQTLKDTYFVLLGATSELCPFEKLLELGLNVIGIARPNASRQKKLIQACINAPEGATLTLPVLGKDVEGDLNDPETLSSVAGADLLTHAPEVANWLCSLYPGKRLIIGSYIYLDGANHVRASVAMDSIISRVLKERSNAGLMYLGTPACVYPITKEAHEDSIRRRDKTPWWHGVTKHVLGPYKFNVEAPVVAQKINSGAKDQSKEIYMFNGIINVQGPNYLLAKTIQNWRIVVAREVLGRVTSVNMAPTCSTDSVMHVKTVARGVRGMRGFPPLTYYEPPTAKGLMGLLLIYDICCDESFANPKQILKNPMEIFATLGVHGGLWRSPYSSASISKTAFVLDLVGMV